MIRQFTFKIKETVKRKEDSKMRTLTYSLIGLFFISLLLVATSFAEERAMQWDSFVATDLLGRGLETSVGEHIGNIDDLAINPSTGRVDSVLVNDVTGVGAQVVAVPFDDISKIGQGIFVYSPREGMYGFPGKMPYWSYGLNELPPMREGDYKFSTLLGASVESKEGEHIARINDSIIDSDGHVAYVVLDEVGGGDKMVAVPFGALSKKGDRLFALDTTKERLVEAPAFTWSDVTDLQYATNIYQYYGLQPYWETR
jgi:sporulation protein YlmC with PRC-barrel domain